MRREYVIARYEHGGRRFEILVDPDKALAYREGAKIPIDEVLIGDYIYKDVKSGDRVSPEDLRKVFGTDDVKKVADIIIKRGELQLTTQQRRRLLEAKRRQIINYIARSAIDPTTKTPIPPQRIEKAMEQARVAVDLYKSVEEQAAKIVKQIARYIPIKIAKALITMRVPPSVAPRAYSTLRKLGEVKNERWLSDGSLLLEIEIPAGLQTDVIQKAEKATKGQIEIEVRVA